MKSLFFLLVTLLMACLVACSEQQPTLPGIEYTTSEAGKIVVADVNGEIISRAEIDFILAFKNTSPQTINIDTKQDVLEELINDQVMAVKAQQSGFLDDPELKVNLRKLMAHEYRKYIEKQVAQKIRITDAEAEAYYSENIDDYTRPAMFRLAIIERRNDIEQNYQYSLDEIKKSAEFIPVVEGFGQYAMESTHSDTRNRGGKLSWMMANTRTAGIPQALIKTGAELEVGELSIIDNLSIAANAEKYNNKSYIIRKIAEKPKQITSFVEVRADIKEQLLEQQKRELYQHFLQQAKDDLIIQAYPENLNNSQSTSRDVQTLSPPGFPVQ